MAHRRLQLLRLAQSLETGDQATVTAVAVALREAADGGDLTDSLAPAMSADDMAARDHHIRRAADRLPGLSGRQAFAKLSAAAKSLEDRIITGEIDPDRPGSWPPMPEPDYHLTRALTFGGFPSRSRFFSILSSEPEDWTPRSNTDINRKLNEALRKWKTPA